MSWGLLPFDSQKKLAQEAGSRHHKQLTMKDWQKRWISASLLSAFQRQGAAAGACIWTWAREAVGRALARLSNPVASSAVKQLQVACSE